MAATRPSATPMASTPTWAGGTAAGASRARSTKFNDDTRQERFKGEAQLMAGFKLFAGV